MDVQVFVERVNDDCFRASALTLSVEGTTRLEALNRLRELIQERLAAGALVETIRIPDTPPHAKYAGSWKKDDPVIQEYLAIIEENRRKADLEENPL